METHRQSGFIPNETGRLALAPNSMLETLPIIGIDKTKIQLEGKKWSYTLKPWEADETLLNLLQTRKADGWAELAFAIFEVKGKLYHLKDIYL